MDDLISRQAVLDVLRTMYDTHNVETEDGDEYIDYNGTVYEVENLPSAEPKIKPCTAEYQRVYRKGWDEGRRKLVDAMEKEIAI